MSKNRLNNKGTNIRLNLTLELATVEISRHKNNRQRSFQHSTSQLQAVELCTGVAAASSIVSEKGVSAL